MVDGSGKVKLGTSCRLFSQFQPGPRRHQSRRTAHPQAGLEGGVEMVPAGNGNAVSIPVTNTSQSVGSGSSSASFDMSSESDDGSSAMSGR